MRLFQENLEVEVLNNRASYSVSSKGRAISEQPCDIRTDFQRDRDRILHSKAFRRLKHKTQVFIAPEGDHYRTRLTHTLEVAQISRTVARALRLNEDLTEAIALGHDLGHTPFGHAGEEVLDRIHPGFRHNKQSLRVVDCLEKLNLTWEVRDGILNHSGPDLPETLEGQIVRICDRIAYINHDIDDAVRAEILTMEHLPADCIRALGATTSKRINTLVRALVQNSKNCAVITPGRDMAMYLDKLRDFMFATVYVGSTPKIEEAKAKQVVDRLYHHFLENPHLLPDFCSGRAEDVRQDICDYIAGMTDRYVIGLYKKYFLPTPWQS